MNLILQHILVYLLLYKYITLFIVSFVAAVIIPIPSGSVLMAAAAFASVGYFDITTVFFISLFGNIIGDTVGYFLSRLYGVRILGSVGFRKILASKIFVSIESRFSRHPGFIIFISRFEVLSTLCVNTLSGIGRVPYRKFLLHEIPGSIVQVSMYASIGYFFGDNWQSINTLIGKFMLIIVLILIILGISLGQKRLRKVFG